MNASKNACPTKVMLMVAWHTAAEAYSKTVFELSRQIGVVSKPEYERLKTVAENARKSSMQAQANLEAHISQHGCDGEAAA